MNFLSPFFSLMNSYIYNVNYKCHYYKVILKLIYEKITIEKESKGLHNIAIYFTNLLSNINYITIIQQGISKIDLQDNNSIKKK